MAQFYARNIGNGSTAADTQHVNCWTHVPPQPICSLNKLVISCMCLYSLFSNNSQQVREPSSLFLKDNAGLSSKVSKPQVFHRLPSLWWLPSLFPPRDSFGRSGVQENRAWDYSQLDHSRFWIVIKIVTNFRKVVKSVNYKSEGCANLWTMWTRWWETWYDIVRVKKPDKTHCEGDDDEVDYASNDDWRQDTRL